MKTLKRLRLINWHYFTNVDVDIKEITFLTGPNGTGKSTIIDALQILVLGSTRPDNFNKAANEKGKSGRNLLSYLRGQTGVKDDGSVVNLRPGSFTSYIAGEFYDDVLRKTFSLGVVFDVDGSDKIDKHYFYLDREFPENGFSNSDTETNKSKIRPLMYKELSQWARNNLMVTEFEFFDTDTEYQAFSKEAFGNLPDKYFRLFKKAVSFSPISNISSFITEYICDADLKVDITPMQKNIEQYKILETEAKRLKVKVEQLERIHNLYGEYESGVKRSELLSYISARVAFEEGKKKLESNRNRLEKAQNKLEQINDDVARFDAQIESINKDLTSYQAKVLQSSNYSLTEKISAKKDETLKQISAIELSINQSNRSINQIAIAYDNATSSLLSYYNDFDSSKLGDKLSSSFDSLLELAKEVAFEAKEIEDYISKDSLDLEKVKNLKNDIDMFKDQSVTLRSKVNDTLFEITNQLQSLQSDLAAVNAGRKPFDKLGPAYLQIKKALETALKARHSDAYVKIYCDLINVNDSEWTMALEAVLYRQKFNFFVNPEYYEEANRILKELSDSYHYYQVSLVDSERLIADDITANDDSIAKLITTDDRGARVYTDYLLGRIKKCSTFQEARDSKSGLLSDCTGYRGYATWYLNKASARIFFIGTQVSSNAKSISSSDYQNMNNLYSVVTELNNRLQMLNSLQSISDNEYANYLNEYKRKDDISILEDKLTDIDAEMKNAAMGDLSLIQSKIEELKKSKVDIDAQRNELLTNSGEIKAEIKRLKEEDIPNSETYLENQKEILNNFDEKIVNEEFEPFFNRLIEEKQMSIADIKNKAYSDTIQIQSKLTRDRTNLFRFRTEYCNTYHLNYDSQNEKDNLEFDKEYENISKVMLPDYEEKILKAHSDSIREFKDDFIYKLRTAIETVNAQIEELNKALEDSTFGRDSYQFKVSPNKDYLNYYDMIMDPLLLKAGDAENLFMEKYKTTMNDLFDLISSSKNSTDEQQKETILRNIEAFTTYTTYIVFDLLVKKGTDANAPTISLGRSFTSQSGGETQTPFYISILASFAQLCRVNNTNDSNTLRLVIFDEAFSKMDSARIMKSTELLRNFNLQAILSTPAEKLRDLISYVDLILVTIHEEKKKKSYLDVYQDKKKRESEEKKETAVIEEQAVTVEDTEINVEDAVVAIDISSKEE